MLRAVSARARINTVSTPVSSITIQSVDDPISFPPINSTRVTTPYYDALVLTLCIDNFDVHMVLVDLGSAADLLHLPAFQLELASRAGGLGWAEPTPGQENNRADRAGPDLNRAAISLTQPGPISG